MFFKEMPRFFGFCVLCFLSCFVFCFAFPDFPIVSDKAARLGSDLVQNVIEVLCLHVTGMFLETYL